MTDTLAASAKGPSRGLPMCVLECQLNMALAENHVLTRELGRIQCRVTRFAQEQAERIRVLEAELLRMRAQWIRCVTENAYLREDHAAPVQPQGQGKAVSSGAVRRLDGSKARAGSSARRHAPA